MENQTKTEATNTTNTNNTPSELNMDTLLRVMQGIQSKQNDRIHSFHFGSGALMLLKRETVPLQAKYYNTNSMFNQFYGVPFYEEADMPIWSWEARDKNGKVLRSGEFILEGTFNV